MNSCTTITVQSPSNIKLRIYGPRRPGARQNTLAVEIHNRGVSSSDIGFDLRLFGAADLVVVPEPGTVSLIGLGLVALAARRSRPRRRG